MKNTLTTLASVVALSGVANAQTTFSSGFNSGDILFNGNVAGTWDYIPKSSVTWGQNEVKQINTGFLTWLGKQYSGSDEKVGGTLSFSINSGYKLTGPLVIKNYSGVTDTIQGFAAAGEKLKTVYSFAGMLNDPDDVFVEATGDITNTLTTYEDYSASTADPYTLTASGSLSTVWWTHENIGVATDRLDTELFDISIQVQPVPEPSSTALLGLGALSLLLRRKKLFF